MRTGDLGFLHENELYITGRLKDCIIIRGRNHYPQDIEKTVEQCSRAIRMNGAAAFAVQHANEEKLVVVAEVNRRSRANLHELMEAIRNKVAEEHEIEVFGVVILRGAAIPRTSSGKVQRRLCKEQFQTGKLPELVRSVLDESVRDTGQSHEAQGRAVARKASLVEHVLQAVAGILGLPLGKAASKQKLTSLGMDSLKAFQIKVELEERFKVPIPVRVLWNEDISGIAQWIWSQPKAGNQGPGVAARTIPRPDEIPLSSSQEQIWLLHQLFPDSVAYNEAFVIELTGMLAVPALTQALNELIARHEIIHTHFELLQATPRQVIGEPRPVELQVLPLENSLSLVALERREAERPFCLEKGPLVRFTLARLEETKHFLIAVSHHIICDGGSLPVIVEELGALYSACQAGLPSPLPAMQAQYADFAIWQRCMSSAEGQRQHLDYWRKQLGDLPMLGFPTDHVRPAVASYRGSGVLFEVAPELVSALKQVVQKEEAALPMVLMGAWQITLSRYARQRDVAVGMAAANRKTAELQRLIGFFVTTLVIRPKLEPEQPFCHLLAKIKQVMLEAYEHDSISIETLAQELQPERSLSHTPLFQAMFVFNPTPLAERDFGGVRFGFPKMEAIFAKFDLTLRVLDEGRSLSMQIEYNSDLFERADAWNALPAISLRCCRHRPGTGAAGQSIALDRAEEQSLLTEWNRSERDFPLQPIHEMFEEQAARTPEAPALRAGDTQLSYAELGRRANRVANFLRTLGIGPESRVGICMQRNPEMIVALLGVLKPGGAYVPLDLKYPVERLNYMLRDANISVLLSDGSLQERTWIIPVRCCW